MWSKIKKFTLAMSIQVTIFYIGILFCILFIMSFFTVWGIQYILFMQAENDITASANNITSYLATGHPLDQQVLNEDFLPPDVILRIYDEQNNLIIDNAPYTINTSKPQMREQEGIQLIENTLLREIPRHAYEVNHTHFYYLQQLVQQNGHSYQLYFMKIISEKNAVLKTLSNIMKASNLVALLFIITSGIFIIRNILRPIRKITAIAKEIEINDLSKRIHVKDSNDELHHLAKTFNHMLDRLQMGFEQQQRFVADASHELRTPITVISGYANMLDRWGKQDECALQEGISAIKSEAANMYELIEKLLFLARTDQSNQVINKTNLDMQGLMEEIVQETQLIAPNHQILLTKNDSAIMYADSASIKQMLRIFIENSIKYTPVGGTIRIASQQIGNYLHITIQDTGIGISQEEQSKVFDRFYRVDASRSKLTGGAGLGLSIAQCIARQHDIEIQLTSIVGEGTTIRLQIPLPSKSND